MNKILRRIVFSLLIGLCVFQTSIQSPLRAQEEDERTPARAKKEPAKKESAMKGQSRELEGDWFLTREDHPVKLSATYYYGNADKETTPVLLLHDAAGSRKDFMPLITQLTGAGYAVLAPDLRGHGQSVKRYEITPPTVEMKTKTVARPGSGGGGNRKPKVVADPVITPGSKKLVDYLAEDFQPLDYALMIKADVPLLLNTLEKVHAEGMANLNRLVVLGVGRGAALASYIATQDWKDKESDRFTKTLILIAPMDISAGVDTTRLFSNSNLRPFRDNVAVFTAVPQYDTASKSLADKIRLLLLDKDAEEDKGGMESKYPIMDFPTEKTVKTDKGETKVEMTRAEWFSNPNTKLGPAILNFLSERNKAFKEREGRWTRLK